MQCNDVLFYVPMMPCPRCLHDIAKFKMQTTFSHIRWASGGSATNSQSKTWSDSVLTVLKLGYIGYQRRSGRAEG